MPVSTCTICHRMIPLGESRCPEHKPQRTKPSAHSRGYGSKHRALRARYAPLVAQGNYPCARCHRPITKGTPWHLGHVDGSPEYAGPEHAYCNNATRTKGRATAHP